MAGGFHYMEMIISENQIFDDMSQLSILINHLNKTSVVESCLGGKGNLKIAISAEKNILLSLIFLFCHFVLSSLLKISDLLVTFLFLWSLKGEIYDLAFGLNSKCKCTSVEMYDLTFCLYLDSIYSQKV